MKKNLKFGKITIKGGKKPLGVEKKNIRGGKKVWKKGFLKGGKIH